MLALAVCVLILKVTVVVMTNYRDYVPPNFESDFLLDREAYFWNGYHWAFYSHIVAGPCTVGRRRATSSRGSASRDQKLIFSASAST